MLKKCLKYDLKSIFTFWWIGALTTIGLSLIASLSARQFFATISEETDAFPWWAFICMASFFVGIAYIILISILVYVRFYKQFFTDEAYLTFTLPVKRSTHLMSKVVSGTVFTAGTGLLVILSMVFIFIGIPGFTDMFVFYGITFDFTNLPLLILYGVEILVLFILSSSLGLQIMYLCITLAHMITRKHTILVTIGLMYGYEFVMQFFISIGMILGSLWVSAADSAFSNAFSNPAVAMILLFFCALFATLNVLVHFITLGCLERKLNLS